MADFLENVNDINEDSRCDTSDKHYPCNNVDSNTLPLCDGTDITPSGISGPLVAKIPVVIAEKKIQIDTEAYIKMPCKDYEIKRIKKDVYLTQCKLLPLAGKIEGGIPKTGKLFISGYVRKNIEYVPDGHCGNSHVDDKTVDVPFQCVTEVTYDKAPQISVRRCAKEIDYLCNTMKCDCSDPDQYMGKNPFQNDFIEKVKFNEEPFCELEESKTIEADIQKAPFFGYGKSENEKCWYSTLTEKMVIYLRIKVLQLQQVKIDC